MGRCTRLAAVGAPQVASRKRPFQQSHYRVVRPRRRSDRSGARLIGDRWARTLGQTVIHRESRRSRRHIGHDTRVQGRARRLQRLAVHHIAHATAPALYDSLRYDVVKRFDHLGRINRRAHGAGVEDGFFPPKTSRSCWTGCEPRTARRPWPCWRRVRAAHLCMLNLMSELGLQMEVSLSRHGACHERPDGASST